MVSSSLAYPSAFSITIWLISFSVVPSSAATPSAVSGKKMWPSFRIQPRAWAKEMTSPSESRKRRDFAELMGRLGYARSLLEAISERIWKVRIF